MLLVPFILFFFLFVVIITGIAQDGLEMLELLIRGCGDDLRILVQHELNTHMRYFTHWILAFVTPTIDGVGFFRSIC